MDKQINFERVLISENLNMQSIAISYLKWAFKVLELKDWGVDITPHASEAVNKPR